MKKKFNGFNCIQKANPAGHCSDRKCAFTLAETMIVVVVLGIIATLTIPALVNKNKESVAKTKVRKAMAAYESALNKMIIENDLKSDTALNEWAGATANCGNPSNYFKKVQDVNGCIFKTSDGIWWNISDIERPLIAFKQDDLTTEKANAENDYSAFVLVGRFGNDGSLRVDDLAYETANDTDNSKAQVEKLYSLLGMKSNKAGVNQQSEFTKNCVIDENDSNKCTLTFICFNNSTETCTIVYEKVTIQAAEGKQCIEWNNNDECIEWKVISSIPAGEIWIVDLKDSINNETDASSSENCEKSPDQSYCIDGGGDYWTLARRYCAVQNAHVASSGELAALYKIGKVSDEYWAGESEGMDSHYYFISYFGDQGLVESGDPTDSFHPVICVGN